jgi:pyridoxine/pyridoxamine 5'-phosphate oxidase
MINLISVDNSIPYKKFINFYNRALKENQNHVNAISISSYNSSLKEVDSRFVNLKYIVGDEWIFFSNYNSSKAHDFNSHKQISVLIYWSSIDVQIRIKANVEKSSKEFSDKHFHDRNISKNILAISSEQSKDIGCYEEVVLKYTSIKDSDLDLTSRPDYWGGFSFKPFYFEFWEGHESRINKRETLNFNSGQWKSGFLQP